MKFHSKSESKDLLLFGIVYNENKIATKRDYETHLTTPLMPFGRLFEVP